MARDDPKKSCTQRTDYPFLNFTIHCRKGQSTATWARRIFWNWNVQFCLKDLGAGRIVCLTILCRTNTHVRPSFHHCGVCTTREKNTSTISWTRKARLETRKIGASPFEEDVLGGFRAIARPLYQRVGGADLSRLYIFRRSGKCYYGDAHAALQIQI